ncbi:MAG: hypothetical protein ACPGOY_12390 [Rhodospirillaceae bacterium]
MILGRFLGWLCICVAILIASGEAVLALGTGTYDGLATREVWILLSGTPDAPALPLESETVQSLGLATIWQMMMELPAWAVIGPFGFILVLLCRPRRRPQYSYRLREYS